MTYDELADIVTERIFNKWGLASKPVEFTFYEIVEMLENELALPPEEQLQEVIDDCCEAIERCIEEGLDSVELMSLGPKEDKACCFFGHREIYENIDKELSHIVELFAEMGTKYFYVGGMGDFDRMATGAVKRAKKKYPDIKLYLVKPYFSNELNINKEYYEETYDEVIIPGELAGVHYKKAITLRNEWMISQCDCVIVYVKHEYGGAYSAMKYAKKHKKITINMTCCKS